MASQLPDSSGARTIVIGLDGATFDLIQPWCRRGYLPTISRLLAEGSHAVLDSFPNMNSAAAWTSIVTGQNAGKHGVYGFSTLSAAGLENSHPTSARDRRRDPFWTMLCAAGKRVGVMNVPISYPADPVDGFMVSGMDAPGTGVRGFAHPAGFLDELRSAGIKYMLDVENLKETQRRGPDHMPRAVREMVQARTQAFSYGIERFNCDVGMVVFVATDRMQHFYWGNGPVEDDPSWLPLRELYQLLDTSIAQIMDRVGRNTNVFVVSDHGFGRNTRAPKNLDQILEGAGLYAVMTHRTTPRVTAARIIMQLGRKFLPPRLQLRLATRFNGLRLRTIRTAKTRHIDWARTQVYSNSWQGLYINAAGRNPAGIVPPDQFDRVRELARSIVSQLTDPDSGKPAVSAVFARSNLYSGPFSDKAADLTVRWNRANVMNGLCYPGPTPIVVRPEASSNNGIFGTHYPEGILIAHGPQIRAGVSLDPLCQYDIAPTVLYLQGQPIPADMDGRVLTGLIDADYLERHPVQTSDRSTDSSASTPIDLDERDVATIEERLRGLGYIE